MDNRQAVGGGIKHFSQCLNIWAEESYPAALFYLTLFGSRARVSWLMKTRPEGVMYDAEFAQIVLLERTFDSFFNRMWPQAIAEFEWVKRDYNMKYWMDQVVELPVRMHELEKQDLIEIPKKLKKIEKLWHIWLGLCWTEYDAPVFLKENPIFLIWKKHFEDIDLMFQNNKWMFSEGNKKDFFNQLAAEAGNPPFWWLENK